MRIKKIENLFYKFFRFMEKPLRKKQEILLNLRSSYSQEEFISAFPQVDKKIVAITWDAFRNEAVIADFKPCPSDIIEDIYGIVDGDLDDLVLDILQESKCRIPSFHEVEHLPEVITIKDVVEFVARFFPGD